MTTRTFDPPTILASAILPVVLAATATWYGGDRTVAHVGALWAILATVMLCLTSGRLRDGLVSSAEDLLPGVVAVVVVCSAAVASTIWSIEPGRAYDFAVAASLLLVALPAGACAFAGGAVPILAGVVAATVAAAVFGIAVVATGADVLVFAAKTDYLDWVTGPFVNRNAAADFLLVGLLSTVALAVARPSLRFVSLLAGIVLVLAIVGTGSRAGIAVSVASGVALGLLLGGRARRIAFGMVAVSIPFAAYAFARRVPSSEDSDVARLELWKDAVASIVARPLGGSGAGTYPTLSTLERGDGVTTGFTWDSSHSLYLDGAATLGIPVTLAIVVASIALIVSLLRRRHALTTVAAVGIGAFMAHAVVDFSPATGACILALAILVGTCAGLVRRNEGAHS